MARIITGLVVAALLGACGDDTGGEQGQGGGGSSSTTEASTGSGNTSAEFRAAVEAFCDAGCACVTCTEGDAAECVEAYLAYETPDDAACSAEYIDAFECATDRQGACDEEPVASLQACEPADACG